MRNHKRQRQASVLQVLFENGSERDPKRVGVELTDAIIEKVCTLRDAVAKYNPDRSGAFASVTFPLAASDPVKVEAKKIGIPTTSKGICFAAGTPEELDLAFAQFWDLANRVQGLTQLPEDQEE